MSKGSGGSGTTTGLARMGGRVRKAAESVASTVGKAGERAKQAVKRVASRIGGAVRGALSRLRGR